MPPGDARGRDEAQPGLNRVFINGRYLTQATTGVQRCAAEIVRAIDGLLASGSGPAQSSFTLLTPPQTPRPSLSSISVCRVGRMRGQLWEQLELPVHARGGLLLSFANAAPLASPRQCVTIHDASVFAVPEGYRPAFRTWYRFLLPALGRRAKRVFTDSAFSRDELARRARIPRSKLRVVPLAGEHILDSPSDPTVLEGHESGRPYLVAVSSGSRHKNLHGIFRAMATLGREDYDLVVVGGHTSNVFHQSEAQSQRQVRRLGYISDGQLRALYENAVGLVYPSFYEGFGLPPLEAMMCGCPVIASNAASLPEVCGEAALYCDPSSPADIAARISELLDRPLLRQELRTRALSRSRRFRWTDTAQAVLREVHDLVGTAPPLEAVR